jgi:hypothetical protein
VVRGAARRRAVWRSRGRASRRRRRSGHGARCSPRAAWCGVAAALRTPAARTAATRAAHGNAPGHQRAHLRDLRRRRHRRARAVLRRGPPPLQLGSTPDAQRRTRRRAPRGHIRTLYLRHSAHGACDRGHRVRLRVRDRQRGRRSAVGAQRRARTRRKGPRDRGTLRPRPLAAVFSRRPRRGRQRSAWAVRGHARADQTRLALQDPRTDDRRRAGRHGVHRHARPPLRGRRRPGRRKLELRRLLRALRGACALRAAGSSAPVPAAAQLAPSAPRK